MPSPRPMGQNKSKGVGIALITRYYPYPDSRMNAL